MTFFATDNVASNIVARMCCSYCLGGILLWVLHSVRDEAWRYGKRPGYRKQRVPRSDSRSKTWKQRDGV